MKFCTKCGNPVTPEQKFCTKRGNPLVQPEMPPAQAPQVQTTVETVVEVTPEPVAEPQPEVMPEPEAPTPAPVPDYKNALEIILVLGKAGFVSDVLDEPAELGANAKNAWSEDSLGAVVHKSGASEYVVVFATASVDEQEYFSIATGSVGRSSARYGNWVISVAQTAGPSNDTALQLERVFSLLG